MDTEGIAKRLEALEQEVRGLRAVQEIQNLMGRYCVNHVQKNMAASVQFYALSQPDVSVEIADRGVFVGEAALRSLFQQQFQTPDHLQGYLLHHYLATPMIEIAGDLKTAKGVWYSPGIEAVTGPDRAEPQALWSFGAYAVDFIYENGNWKIWHMHWFRCVKADFHKGWVDDLSMTVTGRLPNSPELQPTTYHNPYTPASVQESIPPCPAPYHAWDSADWAVKERPAP